LFLSRPDILEYLRSKRLRFEPEIAEDRVPQVSIDLLLGRRFTRFKDKPGYLPAIQMDPSLWESTDLWEDSLEADLFCLHPGQFVLAQTLERVYIPNDLIGLVEGRSSYARIGITVHVTAPKIAPGFNAHITLEMANFGKMPVNLRAGIDKPAQLLLAKITTPLEESELYGANPTDVFQHQTDVIPRPRKP
jgi:dCTP deaminase